MNEKKMKFVVMRDSTKGETDEAEAHLSNF
jgi:hypothetical protein